MATTKQKIGGAAGLWFILAVPATAAAVVAYTFSLGQNGLIRAADFVSCLFNSSSPSCKPDAQLPKPPKPSDFGVNGMGLPLTRGDRQVIDAYTASLQGDTTAADALTAGSVAAAGPAASPTFTGTFNGESISITL